MPGTRPRTIGESKTQKTRWVDLQDSDEDADEKNPMKRLCRDDVRSSREDFEGESKTQKARWVDLQDSDEDVDEKNQKKRLCQDDVRSSREDFESQSMVPLLVHTGSYVHTPENSFDEWASCGNFKRATAFSKEELQVPDVLRASNSSAYHQPSVDQNEGEVSQNITAAWTPDRHEGELQRSTNVRTTTCVSGANVGDEWPCRHEKRKRVVLSIKTSSEYGYDVMSRLRADAQHEVDVPATPNAYDPSISKRKWEKGVKEWKDALKQFALTPLAMSGA